MNKGRKIPFQEKKRKIPRLSSSINLIPPYVSIQTLFIS